MGGGPLVAGAGLLLLVRTDASADYVTQILPGVLVFGLGLSATVAPLTATVLGAVEPGHSGVASGVNNAVARVAGLLAIAALGAVVASSFSSRLDHDLAGRHLSPQAAAVVASDRTRALVIDRQRRAGARSAPRSTRALVDASVYAFRIGMGIGAGLAVLGGLVALIGIENPRRKVKCADCPGGALLVRAPTSGAWLRHEPVAASRAPHSPRAAQLAGQDLGLLGGNLSSGSSIRSPIRQQRPAQHDDRDLAGPLGASLVHGETSGTGSTISGHSRSRSSG